MMRSTTQGNLEIVTDGLQFFYDAASPNSYSNISPTANRLYNLASNDDIILPQSGSTAILVNQEYFTDYGGYLKCDGDSYIQCSGFSDLSDADWTIEVVFSPQNLNNISPNDENYIIKSDNDDGFFIKYYATDPNNLQISSINGSSENWPTYALEANNFYQLTMTYDISTKEFEIRINGELDILSTNATLWNYFKDPFKLGYNFQNFWFSQFRLYNRKVTRAELLLNKEQVRRRFEGLLV